MAMRGAVVVASNRAAAGVYEDTTGPLLVDLLVSLGFTCDRPLVVPDLSRFNCHRPVH